MKRKDQPKRTRLIFLTNEELRLLAMHEGKIVTDCVNIQDPHCNEIHVVEMVICTQ